MSALRLLSRPVRPLAATTFSRHLHSTPARLVTRTQAPGQMPYGEQNTKRQGKPYKSPYDVPLTEQAVEVAGDVKEKLADVAGKAKRLTKQAIQRVKTTTHNLTGDQTRSMFTSASTQAPHDADSSLHNLKENARELKDTAADKLSDAWASTKSAARKAKNVIVDAAQTPVPPSDRLHLDDSGLTERDSMAPGFTNERHEPLSNAGNGRASATFTASDMESDSDPVRQAARSEVLSTTAGRRDSWQLTDVDAAAEHSADSMGLEQDSVKKSLFDGPQEMPQGVGKRARSAEGKPMETGTRGS